MRTNEAARRLRDLEAVRQLLTRAARDACAFGDALATSIPTDDEAARRRRALLADLSRTVAGLADALEALGEMIDELVEPRQGDRPGGDA